MSRIALFAATLVIALALAACGGGADAGAEQETIREAVAFVTSTDGNPGVFVSGRNVVLNYEQRPPTFAEHARKAALDSSVATGGRQIMVFVVDSAEVATAVPPAGQFYCSITANDGRMAGNNC